MMALSFLLSILLPGCSHAVVAYGGHGGYGGYGGTHPSSSLKHQGKSILLVFDFDGTIRRMGSKSSMHSLNHLPQIHTHSKAATAQSLSRAGGVPAPDVVSIFRWIGDQGGVYQGSRLLVGLATGGYYFCPTAPCPLLLYPTTTNFLLTSFVTQPHALLAL